jgi:hypothetical protein
MSSLQIIAEHLSFPRQDLNGSYPCFRLHSPGFPAKAIVMFAAEFLQLSHQAGMLAALNLDQGDEAGMEGMGLGGVYEMWKA